MLLAFSIVYIYNFGGFIPFLFLNTLISLFIVSAAYTVYVYLRFKFVQKVDKNVIIKGERVNFIIKLCNEDPIIFPFIHISFFGSEALLKNTSLSQDLALNPRSQVDLSFDFLCKYRGEYEIGIKNFYIEDFLGIIRLRYPLLGTKKIIVNPRIIVLDKFYISPTYLSDTQSNNEGALEDITSIKDIRDYNYGDSFKRIHWKLSAKKNELMVKNYQSSTADNISILLDFRKNQFDDEANSILEDKLIEAAIAILYYYLNKWIPVNFVYFNTKLEVLRASNNADFENFYKTLSSVKFSETPPVQDIMKLYCTNNTSSKDIIIFTCQLNLDLYNEIYNTKLLGNNICLIYITPQKFVSAQTEDIKQIIKSLVELGVITYVIDPDDDLKERLGA